MRTKFKIGLWVMLGAIAAFIVFAAAPPPGTYIVPSFFTTNAAKIYGTNGVGVSSNTTLGIYLINAQGVTNGLATTNYVNAATNGLGAGSPQMTNALLWQGPTNGSVSAQILTVESNLTITTVNNTNRQLNTAQPITTTASPAFAAMNVAGTVSANIVDVTNQVHFIYFDVPAGDHVLVTDSQNIVEGGATSTEVTYLSGVTSAIQTQLDAKAAKWSFASNNTVLTTSPTQVDFYGFTSITQANGKVSVGVPSFTDTDTKGISLQTNGFGQTVGSSTNLVVLGAGGVVIKGTNTASGNGTNSLEIGLSRPLLDPFVVIDNVPFYPTNGWNHIVNEEWLGDATSTSVASDGTYPWQMANSGQTVFRVARLVEQDAYTYLSVVTTNAGTATTYFLGSAVGSFLLATNVELIWTARIRVGLTNTSAEVQKLIIGLGDNTANNEPGNGIYITVNTNVNTNSFVGCTGRASARTFNYTQHGSNTWTGFTWINVGARLDGTGTNAFFFCGHSLTNLTKFATNTDNIPNSVLCGPIFTTWRITDTTHALRLTNYCDNFHLWIRPLAVNN